MCVCMSATECVTHSRLTLILKPQDERVLTGSTILCGLPSRCCTRICKLSIVYANLVSACTLTFYRPAPQQQVNITLASGVCPAVMSVKNSNSLSRRWGTIQNILKTCLFDKPRSAFGVEHFHATVKENESYSYFQGHLFTVAASWKKNEGLHG